MDIHNPAPPMFFLEKVGVYVVNSLFVAAGWFARISSFIARALLASA